MTSRPALVVVGTGRVGSALALGLARSEDVTVVPHSATSRRAAVRLGLRIATDAELASAELCFFAVPDGAVPLAVAQLLPRLGKRTALVHCAGALPLAALGRAPGHPRGSFHPLCAVSSPRDLLTGCSIALSASTPLLLASLTRLARSLGCPTLQVPEAGRAAYHASAVLAAGGSVALLAAAVRTMASAGVGAREALAALLFLQRSALRGVEARGLAASLTGPVVRGDLETVRRHAAVLPADLRELYRALAGEMAELARLSAGERRKLLAPFRPSPKRR